MFDEEESSDEDRKDEKDAISANSEDFSPDDIQALYKLSKPVQIMKVENFKTYYIKLLTRSFMLTVMSDVPE